MDIYRHYTNFFNFFAMLNFLKLHSSNCTPRHEFDILTTNLTFLRKIKKIHTIFLVKIIVNFVAFVDVWFASSCLHLFAYWPPLPSWHATVSYRRPKQFYKWNIYDSDKIIKQSMETLLILNKLYLLGIESLQQLNLIQTSISVLIKWRDYYYCNWNL